MIPLLIEILPVIKNKEIEYAFIHRKGYSSLTITNGDNVLLVVSQDNVLSLYLNNEVVSCPDILPKVLEILEKF